MRRCLAMGADRAIRVAGESIPPGDPITTAKALAGVVRGEGPDLVLCGVQSSDAVQGATGTALAELLGLPRVAVVKKLEYDGAASKAVVHRELEGGLVEVTEVETPALLTIQTGINEPRYANLRAIKQAEQQEITVVEPTGLGDACRQRTPHVRPAEGRGCGHARRRPRRRGAPDQGDRRGEAALSFARHRGASAKANSATSRRSSSRPRASLGDR